MQTPAGVSAPASGTIRQFAASSNVTVRFWPCRRNSSTNEVSFITDPDGKTPVSGKMRRDSSGSNVYAASVHPGYYTIVAGVLPCSDSRNVAILPGKDRSIVMRGQDQLIMGSALAALDGTLPAGRIRVTADCVGLDNQSVHYVAAVQNGAYYFESIRGPAKCHVRAFAGGSQDLPVAGFWANAEPFKALRRDISW
ncbi:MAG TPA: hypothetical protein VGK84_11795 [Candidatus Tumulicola sp.]